MLHARSPAAQPHLLEDAFGAEAGAGDEPPSFAPLAVLPEDFAEEALGRHFPADLGAAAALGSPVGGGVATVSLIGAGSGVL
jgi:hypothetical protein